MLLLLLRVIMLLLVQNDNKIKMGECPYLKA